MAVKTEKFNISTRGFNDLIDITSKVQGIVTNFNIKEGIVNIQVVASEASILTLEYEPGLSIDFVRLFEEMVPLNKIYKHDETWHEGNAHAHLRALILGNNKTLSVVEGKIELNTYQQIVLVDFDLKPRIRTIVVSMVY
mgnify:CR=1 FL=1